VVGAPHVHPNTGQIILRNQIEELMEILESATFSAGY
jgi:hypothetical protein